MLEILIVSDSSFVAKYKLQFATFSCYARKYDYKLTMLDPTKNPRCAYLSFFFAKHCAVAEYMFESKSDTFLVSDGDVVAGLANKDLSFWLDREVDADLIFYERDGFPEIASGIYIVRNTEFSRSFLHAWTKYEMIMPPGFSSADNGAIHLAINIEIGMKSRDCLLRYQELIHGQETQNKWWDDYFRFVACNRELMGPPRRWKTPRGNITIIGAYRSWIIDYYSLQKQTNDFFVMLHGVKDFEKVFPDLKMEENGDICLFEQLRALNVPHKTDETWSNLFRSYEQDTTSVNNNTLLVPRWKYLSGCDLRCEPLNDKESEQNKTLRVPGYGLEKTQWQDKRLNLKSKF